MITANNCLQSGLQSRVLHNPLRKRLLTLLGKRNVCRKLVYPLRNFLCESFLISEKRRKNSLTQDVDVASYHRQINPFIERKYWIVNGL